MNIDLVLFRFFLLSLNFCFGVALSLLSFRLNSCCFIGICFRFRFCLLSKIFVLISLFLLFCLSLGITLVLFSLFLFFVVFAYFFSSHDKTENSHFSEYEFRLPCHHFCSHRSEQSFAACFANSHFPHFVCLFMVSIFFRSLYLFIFVVYVLRLELPY
jgi:hypothetical protein